MTTLEVRLADATLIDGEPLVGELSRAHSRSGDAIRFAYDGTWLNHRDGESGQSQTDCRQIQNCLVLF